MLSQITKKIEKETESIWKKLGSKQPLKIKNLKEIFLSHLKSEITYEDTDELSLVESQVLDNIYQLNLFSIEKELDEKRDKIKNMYDWLDKWCFVDRQEIILNYMLSNNLEEYKDIIKCQNDMYFTTLNNIGINFK